MPDEIVTRILRLPGYGIYQWEADEAVNTLTLWIHQTAPHPSYVCGSCGRSVRETHSWTERRLRDLPWGTWTVWLRVGGASRALSPLWRADRTAALRGREGPLHGTAGGRRGAGL